MYKPIDIVVLIIAISVCFVIVFIPGYSLIIGQPLSESKTELLTNLLSGLIAIISMYVGAMLQKHLSRNENKNDNN